MRVPKDRRRKHDVGGAKAAPRKMKRTEFEKELARPQAELTRLQTLGPSHGDAPHRRLRGQGRRRNVVSRITAREARASSGTSRGCDSIAAGRAPAFQGGPQLVLTCREKLNYGSRINHLDELIDEASRASVCAAACRHRGCWCDSPWARRRARRTSPGLAACVDARYHDGRSDVVQFRC
jgi:hypothetical protein